MDEMDEMGLGSHAKPGPQKTMTSPQCTQIDGKTVPTK